MPNGTQSNSWLTRLAIVIVIGVLVGGAWLVYRAVTVADQAEHTLHATILTFHLVEDYVNQTHGAWPRSWEDLKKVAPQSWAMYDWPKDEEELQRRVSIDFTAHPAKLAKQSANEFQAVTQIGPQYDYDFSRYVRPLLTTLGQRH